MYVYILSDYDEHGAENVVASLDRARLFDLVNENWPTPPAGKDETAAGAIAREVYHAEWIEEGLAGLRRRLEKSDEELATGRPHNCHNGWGGMQLHVVKLV